VTQLGTTLDRPTTADAATVEEILAAATRVRTHYTGADAPVTVPDGWELVHVGQAWSVGPIGTGTHLLVDELWRIPSAIATFERQIARASQIAVRP
jgi:hypothetical protein